MKFLIIENDLPRALKFENIGIDIIFIDLEKLGKQERQAHLDSVKSQHNISDIVKIKPNLNHSKILVRVDPINTNTKQQIDHVILAGADIIMLPFFKTLEEVNFFFKCIDGRVKTLLLFEHVDSLSLLPFIHDKYPLQEVYFGLNDLSISLGYNFMFTVITNKILNNSIEYCIANNIKYGIGGIGSFNNGKIPGKFILREYKRLGVSSTILSRGLVNIFNDNESTFIDEIKLLRNEWDSLDFIEDETFFNNNFDELKNMVNDLEINS
jgi:hypothetical protein